MDGLQIHVPFNLLTCQNRGQDSGNKKKQVLLCLPLADEVQLEGMARSQLQTLITLIYRCFRFFPSSSNLKALFKENKQKTNLLLFTPLQAQTSVSDKDKFLWENWEEMQESEFISHCGVS